MASTSMSNLAAAVARSKKQLEEYKASSNEADRKAVVESVIECMSTIKSLEDGIKVLSGKTSVPGLEDELKKLRNEVQEVDRLLIAHQDAIQEETPPQAPAGLTQGGGDGIDIRTDSASVVAKTKELEADNERIRARLARNAAQNNAAQNSKNGK
jgi:hypothetical protein